MTKVSIIQLRKMGTDSICVNKSTFPHFLLTLPLALKF